MTHTCQVLVLLSIVIGYTVSEVLNDDVTEKACDPVQHPVVVEDPDTVLKPLINENGTYEHNLNCKWLIKAPEGSVVSIDFGYIDLDPIYPCVDARLTLYDSNSTNDNHKIVTYCGEMNSPTVHTSYIYMLVWFHTGNSGVGTGFEANFTFIDIKQTACGSGGYQTINWVNGGFTSPNWATGIYPTHSNCKWRINADNQIRLEFIYFDVLPFDDPSACPAHNVTVFDVMETNKHLLGVYCGNQTDRTGSLPTILGSTGQALEVNFQSDMLTGGTGFRLQFIKWNTTELGCSSSKPAVMDWSPGLITGPHSNNSACSWRLNTTLTRLIKLKATYFDLPKNVDCWETYVEVFDGETHNAPLIGKYCGSGWEGEIVFGTNYGFIQYYSSVLYPHTGFQLQYEFYDVAGHACGSGRPIVLTHSNGMISSPNFGQGDYPSFANCQWIIKAQFGWLIRLNIIDFELEQCDKCNCDYLEIYNGDYSIDGTTHMGTYCGRITGPASIITTLPAAYLTFASDAGKNYDGFQISFSHQYSPDIACNLNRPAPMAHEPGQIISYGYERNENYKPNSLCSWLITADHDMTIELRLTEFSVEYSPECYYDSLSLYDGMGDHTSLIARLCGEKESLDETVFKSTGRYMFVKFTSNDEIEFTGFYLDYSFKGTSQKINMGFLPGLLVGIILVGLLFMLLAYCHISDNLKKFKRWLCRRLGRETSEPTAESTNTSTSQRRNSTEDSGGFVPLPVRSVVTPPSDIDNMHYFAIADYAPPTYEEAISTNENPQNNVHQRNSTRQTAGNTNSNTIQPLSADNQQTDQNIPGQSSHSSPVLPSNDIQVNSSPLGNADMGMGILQQAGVYTQNNNSRRRTSSSNSNSNQGRNNNTQNTNPLGNVSQSSASTTNQTNINQLPDLTFSTSVSGINSSVASESLGTASSFTDITQDSNVYNPVYTALHNRSIQNSNTSTYGNLSNTLSQQTISDIEAKDQEGDNSIYDTPKEYKSQENLQHQDRSKSSYDNHAFVKEGSISMDPEGNGVPPKKERTNGECNNTSIDIQSRGSDVNVAFHRVNSTSNDTEI